MVAESRDPSKEPSKDTPKEPSKEPMAAQKPEAPRSIPTAANPPPRIENPTPRAEAPRPASKPKTGPKQIVVTLSGDTGEITKIEKYESTGRRSELSPKECLELADEDDADEIEAVVDEVYRTAVADALGEEEDDEDELAMRRLLVGRLFVRRMLRRGARRLLVRRLLQTQASQTNQKAS